MVHEQEKKPIPKTRIILTIIPAFLTIYHSSKAKPCELFETFPYIGRRYLSDGLCKCENESDASYGTEITFTYANRAHNFGSTKPIAMQATAERFFWMMS